MLAWNTYLPFQKLSTRHEYIHDHFKCKQLATCSGDISSERFPYVVVVSRLPLNKLRMFLLAFGVDIETALESKSNVYEKLIANLQLHCRANYISWVFTLKTWSWRAGAVSQSSADIYDIETWS